MKKDKRDTILILTSHFKGVRAKIFQLIDISLIFFAVVR